MAELPNLQARQWRRRSPAAGGLLMGGAGESQAGKKFVVEGQANRAAKQGVGLPRWGAVGLCSSGTGIAQATAALTASKASPKSMCGIPSAISLKGAKRTANKPTKVRDSGERRLKGRQSRIMQAGMAGGR